MDINIATPEIKFSSLKDALLSLRALCIAYSGGVDSTFLLKAAYDALRGNVLAVTADSPAYPRREMEEAVKLAKEIGARHLVIVSNELEIRGFSENTADRCYLCKNDLFHKIKEEAQKQGITNVADGSNYDDRKDYRPGRKAAKETGVLSPLVDAGITKEDIRYLSKKLGLPTWNKPSLACLSSRIPYNEPITEEKLKRVEKAEAFLRSNGFTQIRVRHHNDLARIELVPEEISMLGNPELRMSIYTAFKAIGFTYVTVDIIGYRTGSMNEALEGVAINGQKS